MSRFTMDLLAWSLAIAVGVINIVFNMQAQRAASHGRWLDGVLTLDFAILFFIGCLSLTLLYSFYAQGVPLARGVILMGAVSIMGGTAVGVLLRGNRLDLVEWSLISAIVVLFSYRFIRSLL